MPFETDAYRLMMMVDNGYHRRHDDGTTNPEATTIHPRSPPMSRPAVSAVRAAFNRAQTPDDYQMAVRVARRLGAMSESLFTLMLATRDRVDSGWRERCRHVAEAAEQWHANPMGPPPGVVRDAQERAERAIRRSATAPQVRRAA